MQKLWRSCSGPGLVLSTAGWLETKASSALSRSFMCASTQRLSSFSGSGQSRRTPLVPCRCGLDGGRALSRAWSPLLREVQVPSLAFLHASPGRGFRAVEGLRSRDKGGILDALDEEKRKEEESGSEEEEGGIVDADQRSRSPRQRTSSVRRQRCGSNGPLGRNLELLTIPGVGPRNLRKLMDKGFEGVAQLKQLCKDKGYRLLAFQVHLPSLHPTTCNITNARPNNYISSNGPRSKIKECRIQPTKL